MAPRTRATVSSAATTAPLAAAPRRRIKVTPLEKEISQPSEEAAQPTTRSTRSRKAAPLVNDEPSTRIKKAATTKTRGRPKKSDNTEDEEQEPEKPVETTTEKAKRTTRSTRATATTVSSEAKGRLAVRASRGTKRNTKEEVLERVQPEEQPEPEHVPATRAATKKKVTFQDIVDDKENQPITTKTTKKTTTSKSTKQPEKAVGLRAKPVRKTSTAASTRTTKRSKRSLSDDEDEKPSKIQRVLTPKKITQVARAATPDDSSEDELNGGKTSVRDLSVSPRRPQTTVMAEAIARTLSPAKKLDFSQQIFQQSVIKSAESEAASLQSPARRLPASTSPAKLFAQSIIASPSRAQNDTHTGLASPARRPIDSPAKLLFPHATKADQRINLAQTSNSLFQSPKRSLVFDPSRMFSHSAIKSQKTELHKGAFLSSPAKKAGMISPLKKSSMTRSNIANGSTSCFETDELSINGMEVTELINDDVAEITVSSHQRASVSPIRTYKLSADELQMDFDDSVLPVRSPLKLSKSPTKPFDRTPSPFRAHESTVVRQDEDMMDASSSIQSTPPSTSERESTFINPHDIEVERDVDPQHLQHDLNMAEIDDDTIVLPQNIEQVTPRSIAISHVDNDTSMDELAPLPEEDVIAKYLKSPNTPATLNEHELTNMLSSPATEETPLASASNKPHQKQRSSPASLFENELSMMGGTPNSFKKMRPTVDQVALSPASLYENELTTMAGSPITNTPKPNKTRVANTPASLYENELTIVGGVTPSSPMSQGNPDQDETVYPDYGDEEAMLATSQTPRASASPGSLSKHETNLSAATCTPTAPAERSSPIQTGSSRSRDNNPIELQTPASILQHELTLMGEASLDLHNAEGCTQTPAAAVALTTFTPDLPIPRTFNLHTIISKVPLKPEGQDSPFKLQVKKRKRPLSLGGQPESLDIFDKVTPVKSARTVSSSDATFQRKTPATTPAQGSTLRTPASIFSGVKSAKRVTSTPIGRVPLSPVVVSGVLSGAVVYVDVRTSEGADASAIYVDLLTGLGAKVLKEWKQSLTHVVFKDGNPKILEKVKLADSHVKAVGVSWPLDCEAQKTWVDEAEYLLDLTSTDRVLQSVTKSVRRKSMEPSMLIADGSGSVKRSRSKSRASVGNRRSIVKPLDLVDGTPSASHVRVENTNAETSTPQISTAKRQANLEKNSLTAAWKSINASHNLGEDTPARRTLELLQKSYQVANNWDDSIISSNSNEDENDENTPRPRAHGSDDYDDNDELLETGLTPAPYKTKMQIGSAPSKINDAVAGMSYRQRVEEMERREMRDNAFGTNKGTRAKGGKRMTMFGFEPPANLNL